VIEETRPADLQDPHSRRKLLRFDPTVSSGTLMQILVLIGGGIAAYTTYQTDKATQKLEIEQVKQSAVAEKLATKESLTELKTDVKEVQRTLNQVTNTLAIINERQTPPKDKR
jgi:uncharacterized protein YlxW (UPF0749 family)